MATYEFDVETYINLALAAVDEVKVELQALARRAAEQQMSGVKSAYPVGKTGNLRANVTMGQINEGSYYAVANAPHVHFYESGTEMRGDTTRLNPITGKPANRGRMKAANVFIPLAQKHRAQMYRDGQAILDTDREIG